MKIDKRKLRNNILTAVFILGLIITLYPLVSQIYYYKISQQVISDFEEEKKNIPDEDILRRIDLARAYNEILDPRKLSDPFDERHEAGRAEYARMLELQERMGHVSIPSINQDIPFYAGTSDNILQKGAGHLEGTSLPVGGENTHTVLTAHRGLPSAKLFTDLNKVKVGDKFYIHNIAETLCYRVDRIITVEPSDFEPVFVVPNRDYATLLTCTPYMINSHRLLVRGERIPYVPEVEEKEIQENKVTYKYKYLFFITLAILVFVVARIIWKKIKEKRDKKY